MKKSILVLLVLTMSFITLFAFTVTDDEGRVLEFDKPFGKIISLYGAHTENVFHLGAGDALIGVSTSEAFPAEVHSFKSYSYKDDAEKFIAANPDLILIRPFITKKYGALIKKLENIGIKIVSFQPENYEEMKEYIEKLGLILGKEKEAEEMVAEFETKLSEFEKTIDEIPENERKNVYFESVHKSFRTPAPGALATFVLENAGTINIAHDAKPIRKGSTIANFPKEKLLERGAVIDFYIAQLGAMNKITMDKIINEGGFGAIKAIREGNVYIVDEKIMSRPTWRLLTGIEEIARIVYPAIFNKIEATENPLNKMRYAHIMVKFNKTQFFTPGYDVETVEKNDSVHTYGDYKDLNYENISATYAETAAFNGMVEIKGENAFNADAKINYATLKEYLKGYYSDKAEKIETIFNSLNPDEIPTENEFVELLEKINK